MCSSCSITPRPAGRSARATPPAPVLLLGLDLHTGAERELRDTLSTLEVQLAELTALSLEALLDARYRKFRLMGTGPGYFASEPSA